MLQVIHKGGSLPEDSLQGDESTLPTTPKGLIETRIGVGQERPNGSRQLLDLGPIQRAAHAHHLGPRESAGLGEDCCSHGSEIGPPYQSHSPHKKSQGHASPEMLYL